MIQAIDNNPLKFSPTPEEAMRIMFGPPTRSYLDARRALDQGFEDLKTHQIKTYSAMQQALNLLMAELDPQVIEHATGSDRGIAELVGLAQGQAVGRLRRPLASQVRREGGGPVETFMASSPNATTAMAAETR